MKPQLDKRLHAYRSDRADLALKGQVPAEQFVSGTPAVVCDPVMDLKASPQHSAEAVSQLLLGETVTVFDNADGWSWVQADRDRYVGYVAAAGLGDMAASATHIVTVPRTFAYSLADLRSPVRYSCSMGSRLTVTDITETRGTAYAVLPDGSSLIASHLRPLGFHFDDYVAVAAMFLETPYLWAGKSGFGFDCSGLVQLSMLMCGQSTARDSDMQATSIGKPVEAGSKELQRGDLVFWSGHVGIMEDADIMIHASGHAMRVVRENLSDAIDRIAHLYGMPTAYRRP
ncbi:MAG: NlpC/P60 family protein [Alphaproteobacteria bacterium]|nr:NlpC/P60 family protein [Alphaproteobacteria bacterium]